MRKFLIGLFIAVVILGGGAAFGEWYARTQLVEGIAERVEPFTGGAQEIELDSFPLLLDLARGEIPAIEGAAPSLAFEGIEFADTNVHASQIRTDGATVITELTGTATSATIQGMRLTALDIAASEIQLEPFTIESFDITAESLMLDGVELTGVSLLARDVETDPEVQADITLDAHITYSQIETLVRDQVGEDADVSIADGVIYVGTEVWWQELSIGLLPEAVDGDLTLVPVEVTLGGLGLALDDLPFGLGGEIQPIPVDLPLGSLRLDSLSAAGDGVTVTLTGTDVSVADFSG